MKKNKKIVITLSIIVLIFIVILLIIGNVKPSNENVTNTQKADFIEGSADSIKLSNKLELNFENIEKIEDHYYFTMVAKNNTNSSIDLSNYRISFQDNNSNEVDWYRGTVVGIVNSHEEVIFTIEISGNKDVKNISKIVYEEFSFES